MKRFLLLPGTVALLLMAAPVVPAFSQSFDSPGPRMEKLGKQLNLTADQKAKLAEIRQSTRTRIEAVLTDEQKAKLRDLRQQQQKIRQDMAALNLTDAQKAQIRSIRQDARNQMESILTDQQKQQLRQKWQQRMQQRQGQPNS